MAKSVNKVILLGYTGKEPEIRALPSGVKVATWTLATTDRTKDSQGNWQERTEWHTLVAYARLAEIVEKYVSKGSLLYIEGKIETRAWNDARTGEKKERRQIRVEDLSLLSAVSAAAVPAQRPVAPPAAPAPQSEEWDEFS